MNLSTGASLINMFPSQLTVLSNVQLTNLTKSTYSVFRVSRKVSSLYFIISFSNTALLPSNPNDIFNVRFCTFIFFPYNQPLEI